MAWFRKKTQEGTCLAVAHRDEALQMQVKLEKAGIACRLVGEQKGLWGSIVFLLTLPVALFVSPVGFESVGAVDDWVEIIVADEYFDQAMNIIKDDTDSDLIAS